LGLGHRAVMVAEDGGSVGVAVRIDRRGATHARLDPRSVAVVPIARYTA
jgi:hypothetical protein